MAEAFSNSAESGGEARPETNGDAAAATPVQAQSSLQKLQEKTQALRTDLQRTRAAKQRGGLSHADYGDGTDPADPDSAKLREEVKQLRNDLERRLASYVRREREYKTQVQVLTEELKKAKTNRAAHVDSDAKEQMDHVRDLHASILKSVEHVQEQTARILAEQERDLLRAFRARLFDVQTELEREKNRSGEGAATWIEKHRQLSKELDWAKEMADKLDRHNQAYIRENARLKTQFKTQEDDREYLIRQLVAAKKDNARLRQELAGVKLELADLRKGGANFGDAGDASPASRGPPGAMSASDRLAALHAAPPNTEQDNRYKDVIRRLKRLLEVERKNLRTVRTQYANELQNRSELEIFLHQCVEDVKLDIARRRSALMAGTRSTTSLPPVGRPGSSGSATAGGRRAASALGGGGDKGGAADDIPLSSFSTAERERVMELLLSQERVISLLYSKTFPPRPTTFNPDGGVLPDGDGAGGGAGAVDERSLAELTNSERAARMEREILAQAAAVDGGDGAGTGGGGAAQRRTRRSGASAVSGSGAGGGGGDVSDSKA